MLGCWDGFRRKWLVILSVFLWQAHFCCGYTGQVSTDYWLMLMLGTGRKSWTYFIYATFTYQAYSLTEPSKLSLTLINHHAFHNKVYQHVHLLTWINRLYVHMVGSLWRRMEVPGGGVGSRNKMEIHIDIDIQINNTWLQAVDIQNATLAGGVIVGASADMMLQVLHRTSPLPLDTCQNLMFPTISIQS